MKRLLFVPLCLVALAAGGATRVVQDQCGPFTDVSALFCPYVLEAYYTGITAGTSATTFSPDVPITRGQAAVFTSKALNQALSRGSRRAALGQWWTTQSINSAGIISLGGQVVTIQSDGTDLWVSDGKGLVHRVHGSDGAQLGVWTGAVGGAIPLSAMGSVFLPADSNPGSLYRINPAAPPGAVETVATGLGDFPFGIAFDGSQIWTANTGGGGPGSVSIIQPGLSTPWAVTNVTTGFNSPYAAIFDGQNIWVTDAGAGSLLRLDATGAITLTVPLGGVPLLPVFDGRNIWVPNVGLNSVAVVAASSGAVVATLSGNGLNGPAAASFDGTRIMIGNSIGVSLWDAASLNPLGFFLDGVQFGGVCSDGLNFWLTVPANGGLVRF